MFAPFLLGCAELRTITVQGSARATIEAGTIIEELLGDLGFEDFVSMDLSQARELRDQGIEPVTLITDIDAHRPAEDTEVEATFTLDVTATVRGLKKAAASE